MLLALACSFWVGVLTQQPAAGRQHLRSVWRHVESTLQIANEGFEVSTDQDRTVDVEKPNAFWYIQLLTYTSCCVLILLECI